MSAFSNLPLVRTLELSGAGEGDWVISLAWSPDGSRIAAGFISDGTILLTAEGRHLWHATDQRGTGASDVSWTPDGRRLAINRYRNRQGVMDPASGEWRWSREIGEVGGAPSSDPSGRWLLFGDAGSARVMDAGTGQPVRTLEVPCRELSALSWSPDGNRIVAGGSGGSLVIFDAQAGNIVRDCSDPNRSTGWVYMAAWSPDSQLFVVGVDNEIRRYTRNGDLLQPVHRVTENAMIISVSWAGAGDLIAAGTWRLESITLMRGSTGEVLEQEELGGGIGSAVCFSPDGRLLAVGRASPLLIEIRDTSAYHVTGRHGAAGTAVAEYAARQALSVGRAHSADAPKEAAAQDVREPWASLVWAAGALHRLDLLCPLSWIVELQRELAPDGEAALIDLPRDEAQAELSTLAGVAALRGLSWTWRARVGLLAMWLEGLDLDDHRAPAGVDWTALARALGEALGGEDVAAEPVSLPRVALRAGLSGLTPGLVGLLELVGPEAMERDPGLGLRLRARARGLPGFTRLPRQLLWGVREARRAGSAQGPWQSGGESVGVQRHGGLGALMTSQLALPGDLFDLRHRRGELLYRAQRAGEPPRLRPLVLLLDVSPPVYGPVERLTRPLAVWLGETLLEAGREVGLVIAGGEGAATPIERREALVELWLRRSLAPAQEEQALSRAHGLCAALRGGDGLDPAILVLSHVWFGAELSAAPRGDVRALLVHYPGQAERAPLARWCDRTSVVVPERKAAGLIPLLGELIA